MNHSLCCSEKWISFPILQCFHFRILTQNNTNLQLLNLYVVNMGLGPCFHMLHGVVYNSMMMNPLRDCSRLSRHEQARLMLPQSVSTDERRRQEAWNALDFVVTPRTAICLWTDMPVNSGMVGQGKEGRKVSWDEKWYHPLRVLQMTCYSPDNALAPVKCLSFLTPFFFHLASVLRFQNSSPLSFHFMCNNASSIKSL